ncbi:hypothetical protein ACOZ4F_00595 (plasmid) [Haloarcula marismortui]
MTQYTGLDELGSTKTAIMQATYKALSKHGYDNLTIQDIADEQGSASAKVVFEDYLTDERKRELRREFMREKLSVAFDTDR